jgi:hypothetical protein
MLKGERTPVDCTPSKGAASFKRSPDTLKWLRLSQREAINQESRGKPLIMCHLSLKGRRGFMKGLIPIETRKTEGTKVRCR